MLCFYMIRIALATAHVLGLKKTKIEKRDLPLTAHFMTMGRCLYDCSFCTQGRSSKGDSQYLSRVIWPEFEKDKIKETLNKNLDKYFKRVCLQVIQSPDYLSQTITFIKYIKSLCHLPLSVSVRPKSLKEVRLLFKTGVDELGLALDVVEKNDYQKIRKGNYRNFLKFLMEASRQFPGKIATHLIIGFSETEKQTVKLIKKLHQNKITVALFAFTPISGTALASQKQPTLSKYRRIQLAHFLITRNRSYRFCFSKHGKLKSVGWTKMDLLDKLKHSCLFQTTGCFSCNRPFYNEKPAGILYNYPHKLSANEFRQAINNLNLKEK